MGSPTLSWIYSRLSKEKLYCFSFWTMPSGITKFFSDNVLSSTFKTSLCLKPMLSTTEGIAMLLSSTSSIPGSWWGHFKSGFVCRFEYSVLRYKTEPCSYKNPIESLRPLLVFEQSWYQVTATLRIKHLQIGSGEALLHQYVSQISSSLTLILELSFNSVLALLSFKWWPKIRLPFEFLKASRNLRKLPVSSRIVVKLSNLTADFVSRISSHAACSWRNMKGSFDAMTIENCLVLKWKISLCSTPNHPLYLIFLKFLFP